VPGIRDRFVGHYRPPLDEIWAAVLTASGEL
jgi:hypothetical protein